MQCAIDLCFHFIGSDDYIHFLDVHGIDFCYETFDGYYMLPAHIWKNVGQDVVHHNTHMLHRKRCMYLTIITL